MRPRYPSIVRDLAVIAGLVALASVPGASPESGASPLFVAAVAYVAWRWGRAAGLVATATSLVAMALLYVPSIQSGSYWSSGVREFSFAATAILIVLLVGRPKSEERCDADRALVSRQIHDDVAQTLAAVDLQLAAISNQLSRGVERRVVQERLHKASEILTKAIETSERISSRLRPRRLDDLAGRLR